MNTVEITASPTRLQYHNRESPFKIQMEPLEGDIWVLRCQGALLDIDRKQVHVMFDELTALRKKEDRTGPCYLLAEVTDLNTISPDARKGFRRKVARRFENKELGHIALVMPNVVLRTFFALIARLSKSPISYSFHRNADSALLKLQKMLALPEEAVSDSLDGLSTEELKEEVVRLKAELARVKTEQAGKVDRLFKSIASISWEENLSPSDPDSHEMEDEDPFRDVFDAAKLLRSDVLDMIQELKDLNSNLERKVIERTREIAQKESNLSALIENTADLVVSVDREYRILVMNTAYHNMILSMYGKSAKPGDLILDLVDKRLHNFWKPLYESAFSGMPKQVVVAREVEGKTFHFDISFNPILEKDGQVAGATIFAKDITEQKIAEDEIRKSQQLLSSINHNINDGIYRSTLDKGLIYANKAFVEMFGYDSYEDIMSIDSSTLYDDPQRRIQLAEQIREGKILTNEEVLYVKKDGTRFYGLTSSIMSHDEEGNRYFDGAIRDVTESKENDRKLREQNEQLKKINAELDHFVYSTSHDLRAPLVSISGLINIARESENEVDRHRYFDLMERSILKLDNFIRDIMNYSRNARAEVGYVRVELKEIIETIFEGIRYSPEYPRIDMRVHIDKKAELYSDVSRIKLIFNNILSNAARYQMPGRETPFIEVRAIIDAQELRVWVKDNGMGIDERYQGKIFNMFYRASNAANGSGLGLYIVKEALEKLQGEIQVKSEKLVGTTFEWRIPNHLEQQLDK